MLCLRPEQTKKRWSEQHAGQHFGHDLRLAESRCDCSYEPTEQENNRKLKKELKRRDADCSLDLLTKRRFYRNRSESHNREEPNI